MTTTPLLFNPRTYDPAHFDPETRRLLRATVDWFEERGKRQIIEDYRTRAWLGDFLAFAAKERLFATFLTPASAGTDEDQRWDTARIAALNEILGFYGLDYWYAWQVTILGLGPVWQSDNATARTRAADLLSQGEVFAFGLSEKAHGADIYSTDMLLEPQADGGFWPAAPSTTSATATPPVSSPCSAAAPTSTARTDTSSSPPTAATRRTTW